MVLAIICLCQLESETQFESGGEIGGRHEPKIDLMANRLSAYAMRSIRRMHPASALWLILTMPNPALSWPK